MTVKRENRANILAKGHNQVRLVGVIASATTSREGVCARRLEIPESGAREILELECEKEEIILVFRSMKVKQWVEVRGRIRRRYWRAGGALASRTYIEVTSISPR